MWVHRAVSVFGELAFLPFPSYDSRVLSPQELCFESRWLVVARRVASCAQDP